MPVDVEIMEDREIDSLVSLHLLTRNTRLVEAREAKGWKQKDVCLMLGHHSQWLTPIETLRRVPNSEDQAAIAEIYGDSPSYLFPSTLMGAITAGVFKKRDAQLDEPQVAALTVSQYQRLTYDGETEMIEELDRKLLTERVGEILETLDPQKRRVIEWRFGLGHRAGEEPRTQREIAERFNLSPARIGQIEATVLRSFRHRKNSRRLRDFLEE